MPKKKATASLRSPSTARTSGASQDTQELPLKQSRRSTTTLHPLTMDDIPAIVAAIQAPPSGSTSGGLTTIITVVSTSSGSTATIRAPPSGLISGGLTTVTTVMAGLQPTSPLRPLPLSPPPQQQPQLP